VTLMASLFIPLPVALAATFTVAARIQEWAGRSRSAAGLPLDVDARAA
jgi:hypothetical protein